MKRLPIFCLLLTAAPLFGLAQQLKPGYIDWGVKGQQFPAALQSWEKGDKWTDDDNFFISRVRPKQRFRNQATQVNPEFDESNDKKLCFWVPVNNETYNALPDGVFDSEVFPMWPYVTHYGNWSTSLIRIPGNFLDVAHRNGVPVTPVASVPWGNISTDWANSLSSLASQPEKVGDYIEQFGVDGLGYNSEFNCQATLVQSLRDMHTYLMDRFRYSGSNPVFENIWYDGTNDNGSISFDRGLSNHNDDNWGYGDHERSILFFNYNWNNTQLLKATLARAEELGRSPLDIYCGINMQGREPRGTGKKWELLETRPLSIGLWGAHSKNMFFEYRGEKGSSPADRQRSYMLSIERWFTGGTRNPLNTPAVNKSLKHNVENYDFFGMSKLMSARSSLCWDLSEEPFVTAFNLGNGRFFNWEGRRCHDSEWYNIGIQDYLPTWKWWFADTFMGRGAENVPAQSLDAEFTWDDAWTGGSTVRVFGSAEREFLHLFKTRFSLKNGDLLTFRYKLRGGNASMSLAASFEGAEEEAVLLPLRVSSDPVSGGWQYAEFRVGAQIPADGKTLAMLALCFENAEDADILLGQLTLSRPGAASTTPAAPTLTHDQVLSFGTHGADAKVIFDMPGATPGTHVYNEDVDVSFFKLYAQQKGADPVLMGATTSWAGLMYSIPVSHALDPEMRLGVAAVSIDRCSESEISWGEYRDIDDLYEVNDDLCVSHAVIHPGDAFDIAYADPRHETADWTLLDAEGRTVAQAFSSVVLELPDGLPDQGNYDLSVTGMEQTPQGRVLTTRTYRAYIQVGEPGSGRMPEITSLTANGEPDLLHIEPGATLRMEYSGTEADAVMSRALGVTSGGVGFRFADTGLETGKSFTVSFWIKPETFKDMSSHLLNIRDKEDQWASNHWGWFYNTVEEDGTMGAFQLKGSEASVNLKFGNTRLVPGTWTHLAYVFDFNVQGAVKPSLYVNGQKQTATSWTRNGQEHTSEPGYFDKLYAWRGKNTVAVGGYALNLGSVRGAVDNMMLWDHAASEQEIQASMEDAACASLENGPVAIWDFENEPTAEGYFLSKGRVECGAGMHDYDDTEVEGQGTFKWVAPDYRPGAPADHGTAYRVETRPAWSHDGVMLAAEGNDTHGTADIRFDEEGIHTVALTLANGYGESAQRRVTVQVGDGMGAGALADRAEALLSGPNPFDTYINVYIDKEGEYRLSLIDDKGAVCMQRCFRGRPGQTFTLSVDVEPGLYTLTGTCEGRRIESRRMLKR